jgi:hypothetical protein
MRITFALIACIALALGLLFVLESKSAIHQILAAITFLVFTVASATVAILGAIAKLQHPTQTLAPALPDSDSPAAPGIFPEAPKQGRNWVKVGK